MRWPDPKEPDPITDEQVGVLSELLSGAPSPDELEGFLIFCSRLVDEFGHHRTRELADVFRTTTPAGQAALRASLRDLRERVGGLDAYEADYPVTVIPPRPAFPLVRIIGIERIAPVVYRVLDSQAPVRGTRTTIQGFIARTGRLPAVPRQRRPVRRTKPRFHWCSYRAWPDPATTREALQILPEWSDCALRATIPTAAIARSAFLAFNGDLQDPTNTRLKFVKYFLEPLAQDHGPLEGGGLQIGVAGAPRVALLEAWSDTAQEWRVVWRARD